MNDDLITLFFPPRTSVLLCASAFSSFSLDPNAIGFQPQRLIPTRLPINFSKQACTFTLPSDP
jgi:hypothetical protein